MQKWKQRFDEDNTIVLTSEENERSFDSNNPPPGLAACSALSPPPNIIQRHYRVSTLVKICGVSEATIWRWVKNGSLAKPVKMGKGRTVAWRETDIEAFLNAEQA